MGAGVVSGGLWIGGFWRKPPPFLYADEDKHMDLGIPRAPQRLILFPHFIFQFRFSMTLRSSLPPSSTSIYRAFGSVTYCASSFVTYLVISLLPPLFFYCLSRLQRGPTFSPSLNSPPAHIDMSIVFSIDLSSSLPPRDFISTLHEGVVCTIVFRIIGYLAQALELQILPLIEKVPSKTVGSHLTRGSEAMRNNKVARSTASMNRNMKPMFVVYVDRCCAEIRRRSKQVRSVSNRWLRYTDARSCLSWL